MHDKITQQWKSTLREKKTTTKPSYVENRERARARNKKQQGTIQLEEKNENFIVAVRNEKCQWPPR